MKFKRTFHVFVDNFSATYKLLLYKIIISVLFLCASLGIIYPIINKIVDSSIYTALLSDVKDFFTKMINGQANELGNVTASIKENARQILDLIKQQQTRIIISAVVLVIIYLVQKFLQGIGNFVISSQVNDKMALHADSPFISTMVKNLGKAAVYNLVYVPLSFLYDVLSGVVIWLLFFKALTFIPFVFRIFLIILAFLLLIIVKMTFTSDWVPAIVCGKKGNGSAMSASFSRRGKKTGNIFSNYIVLVLLIMAMNVGALFLTLGVGMLITVPASYVILISFQLVNYYDANEISYFTDANTVVKHTVKSVSREDFFRGEN